jgi:hypothetical protein
MLPGATPEQEREELQRIAARSNEPLLAYGTDEDAAFGIDPETIQLDLGSDPIAFAAKRLAIARDLFQRQETRALSPDRDYAVLRRSLAYAVADAGRAVGTLLRQIGGVRTLRDFPGSGRDPLQPVAASVQRQALDLISNSVLSRSALTLVPCSARRRFSVRTGTPRRKPTMRGVQVPEKTRVRSNCRTSPGRLRGTIVSSSAMRSDIMRFSKASAVARGRARSLAGNTSSMRCVPKRSGAPRAWRSGAALRGGLNGRHTSCACHPGPHRACMMCTPASAATS